MTQGGFAIPAAADAEIDVAPDDYCGLIADDSVVLPPVSVVVAVSARLKEGADEKAVDLLEPPEKPRKPSAASGRPCSRPGGCSCPGGASALSSYTLA